MRKVVDKKVLEKEAALWAGLKKAAAEAPVRLCHK